MRAVRLGTSRHPKESLDYAAECMTNSQARDNSDSGSASTVSLTCESSKLCVKDVDVVRLKIHEVLEKPWHSHRATT